MSIELDAFTESELIDLNHRIVARSGFQRLSRSCPLHSAL